MRRIDLIKHLTKNGCFFLREGSNHSLFLNPITQKVSTVPRHNEINNFLANKICRDLGILDFKKK